MLRIICRPKRSRWLKHCWLQGHSLDKKLLSQHPGAHVQRTPFLVSAMQMHPWQMRMQQTSQLR